MEFVRESASGKKEQLFLDVDRDLQVVRVVDSKNGQIRVQIDVTSYQSEALLGWLPKTWEFVYRTPQGGIAMIVKCNLVEFEANPTVDPKQFEPVFLPRMRVADLMSGKEIQYGILPDGTKGNEVSGGGHPFESLMVPPARWYKSWKLWLGVAGGSFLVLIAALGIRNLRRGQSPPRSLTT